MRASLIMIIITAVSICLFIPETTPLPPETDYANTPEESEIYNSDTEKLPALSENTDTQSTEASYADIVLEEAFRTIRADYHTFISETRKDETENDISGDSDNGSIQKDGDTQESKASSDTSAETSPEDTILRKTESETETLQKEAENTENHTSQEAESTYSTEINCGINDSSIISVYIHGSGQTLQMTLHDYITGVVASEMPVYFGTEAIRAQAIAARTYAIYKIIGGQDSGEHPGIYLCDATSHCCAYTPKSSSYDKWGESGNSVIQTAEAAVYDTENKVVTYNESCICAVWHSSSVNQTKNAKDVWGSPVAYLCSVPTSEKDRRASGHGVGMSQYGADDMAGQGFSSEEILQHYYTDCIISRLK